MRVVTVDGPLVYFVMGLLFLKFKYLVFLQATGLIFMS